VTKLQKCGGGGSWEWRCTLCNNTYKGSYPRVKAHLLHGGGQGILGCTKTSDPLVRRAYQREQDEADGTKRRHDEHTQATSNIEPRMYLKQERGEVVTVKNMNKQHPNIPEAQGHPNQFRIAELLDW
jgi:hypothetical protein